MNRIIKKECGEINNLCFIFLIVFAGICFTFFSLRLSGFAIEQVFSTNSSIIVDPGIRVIYNTFSGSTTDFLRMSDIQLSNISNMTLENIFGKIVFRENINLTKDSVNNVINLDDNVKIYHRGITINTLSLSSMLKQSRIYFKGISLNSPFIYVDDDPCYNCSILSYSNAVLVVDAPEFSKIEIFETPFCGDFVCQAFRGETCVTCPQDCGYCPPPSGPPSGGGVAVPGVEGGGAGSSGEGISAGGQILGVTQEQAKESFFNINPNFIKITLVQGEAKKETLKITNTGKNNIDIILNSEIFGKFVNVSEISFNIKAGKTKEIELYFYAEENVKPDIYIEKITIESADKSKNFVVILEIKEKKPLFDIKVWLNKKSVYPKEKITATNEIKNLGELKNIDVELYYGIKNFNNDILYYRQESLAIQDKLNVIREIEIPEYLRPGNYIFYSKVTYGKISAYASEQLNIKEIEEPLIKINTFTSGIIISIILIIIIIITLVKLKRRRF
ncbi:MAG: hypothetical protein QXW97_01790 [Candidatus Pacearchaeota archaeon]